jgi:5-hydroxyisourate hydrolase-like protein (transthyretin family)
MPLQQTNTNLHILNLGFHMERLLRHYHFPFLITYPCLLVPQTLRTSRHL